jgi:hypothetical protein
MEMKMLSFVFWGGVFLVTLYITNQRIRAVRLSSTQRQFDKYILLNMLFAIPSSDGTLATVFPYEKENYKATSIITGGMLIRFFFLISIGGIVFSIVRLA